MPKNITKKEFGLIKGALRRLFSRSDLRREVIDASRIQHTDASRPRVTKWSLCPVCVVPTPTYLMEVDHVSPVQKIGEALEDLTLDELAGRIWCDRENLKAICKDCHRKKSSAETKLRAAARRAKKVGK